VPRRSLCWLLSLIPYPPRASHRELTAEDVNRLTRTQLETFWRTFYRPNRAILAVAGDVDLSRLRAAIDKAFGGWARAKVPARPGWTVPPVTGTRIVSRLPVAGEPLGGLGDVIDHRGMVRRCRRRARGGQR